MSVGKQLKRIRELNGLSAALLAKAMRVSPDRLRKWEANDFHPNPNDARKIEKYFGVPLSKLEDIEKFTFSFLDLPNEEDLKTPIRKEIPDIYEAMGMMETRIIKLEAKTSFLQELLQASILGKNNNQKKSASLAADIDEAVSRISVEKAKKLGRKK